MRIDSHIHLYDPSRPEGVPWPPERIEKLYRPHLPADFAAVSANSGITHAIVVEASDRPSDNQWLLQLAKATPEIIGVVGNLDPRDPAFDTLLAEFARDPKAVGIRPRLDPPPSLADPEVAARLATLAAYQLTLELNVNLFPLEEIVPFAEANPDLRIVIGHLAGARLVNDGIRLEERQQLERLGQLPNTFCKLSAFYHASGENPAPTGPEPYANLIRAMVEAFGPERVFFGSNWPVSSLRGPYAPLPKIVDAYFSIHHPEFARAVFYENPLRAFGLDRLEEIPED